MRESLSSVTPSVGELSLCYVQEHGVLLPIIDHEPLGVPDHALDRWGRSAGRTYTMHGSKRGLERSAF